MTLATGDLGIDYSFARPDIFGLPAQIRFVLRYFSHTPAKNITAVEAAAIALSGRDLAMVWETTATRVLSGYGGGQADGEAARAQADAIGYKGKCYFAIDFDLQPHEYDVCEQYGLGFAAGFRCDKSETGPYGGVGPVHEMHARGFGYCWQTVAWSHGQVADEANLYQRLRPTVPVAGTDENVALKSDIGQAGPGVVITGPPEQMPAPVGSDGQRNLFVTHPFLTGPDVTAQQEFVGKALNISLRADGVYGPKTAEAVAQFQSANGLTADGIVGPATRKKEADILAWVSGLAAVPTIPRFPGYARFHDHSNVVGAFQSRLAMRGYYKGVIDNDYGPQTFKALTDFQRDQGIKVDGVGGPVTWTRLWS